MWILGSECQFLKRKKKTETFWVSTEITLNLKTNMGRNDITYFSLFRSSFLSAMFSSFQHINFNTYFKFYLKNFIFRCFYKLNSWIQLLIVHWKCMEIQLIFVYKLIFYPAKLLNSFISFSSFCTFHKIF